MRPTEEEQYYEHWLNERKQQAENAERARVEANRQAFEQRMRDNEERRYWESVEAQRTASNNSSNYSYDYQSSTPSYSGGGGSGSSAGMTWLVLIGIVLVIFMIIWGPAGGIAHMFGIFKFIWGIVKGIFSFFVSIFKMNVYFGIIVVVGVLVLLNKLFG